MIMSKRFIEIRSNSERYYTNTDSQVWLKFELQQSCYGRLLEHALEEQKKINEIWRSNIDCIPINRMSP